MHDHLLRVAPIGEQASQRAELRGRDAGVQADAGPPRFVPQEELLQPMPAIARAAQRTARPDRGCRQPSPL